ncbi:hypothetical protein APY03_1592 [Variovorax sp. WDL1]|nr:hypothetical protein APY03_1592 [Variovorax sp. WDL1]
MEEALVLGSNQHGSPFACFCRTGIYSFPMLIRLRAGRSAGFSLPTPAGGACYRVP